ncbi:peptidase [Arcobacter roscoffensis]|uniref:Peptidase n=1 Tax=Arcobacter roscoffensis TaxID=2961520 RepID=A0ABY5E1P9_9BACT|nr:peptidase [Arcobacter roscoffensis]UTJ05397.1 peptidase [Arcobacter roscoffensis]
MKINIRELLCGQVFYRNASVMQIPKSNEESRADNQAELNENNHRFVLISENNACERYDWWEGEIFIEELSLDGAKYEALKTFFTDHNPRVDTAIGAIENKQKVGKELFADVRYCSDEYSQNVKLKYDEGILTDVSIGYRINEIVETKYKDQPNHILVTDFDIVELSAVWKGADSGAFKIEKNKPENIEDEKRFSHEFYKRKLNLLKRG